MDVGFGTPRRTLADAETCPASLVTDEDLSRPPSIDALNGYAALTVVADRWLVCPSLAADKVFGRPLLAVNKGPPRTRALAHGRR